MLSDIAKAKVDIVGHCVFVALLSTGKRVFVRKKTEFLKIDLFVC